MQNKRMILVMGILVLVVGAAAFLGGRMLNGNVSPLRFFGLGGKGEIMSISINVTPAEELPKTPPTVIGSFVERKDNTIVVASISMKSGGGGVVVGPSSNAGNGPQVEVVVTNETTIYRETTDLGGPPDMKSGETKTIQQTVEESTLDNLNSQSMVTVWGRKSGDRIIADVLFYSNPVMFKRPGP